MLLAALAASNICGACLIRVRVRVRVPWAHQIIRCVWGLGILSVEGRSEQMLLAALAANKICGACIIRVRFRVRVRVRIRVIRLHQMLR